MRPVHGTTTSILLVVALAPASLLAENIDPDDDGSQYAYGENVGWINAEPSEDGGPGVLVQDAKLTGYMWGENVGWISLSCENTSCDASSYGVANDGAGVLSGYAWGENVGWISFSSSGRSNSGTVDYGVTIDPSTGVFSGRAWAENVGWITFAGTTPVAYGVRTSWGCTAPGPPTDPLDVRVVDTGSDFELTWSEVPHATSYDVVRGSLASLQAAEGQFGTALLRCVVNDYTNTNLALSGDPNSGDVLYYLVRASGCGGVGSWNSAAGSEVNPRDPLIASAPEACP